MAGEERIFGPHDYETYRNYMGRLKDDGSLTSSRAAALMATAMLMQGKPNERVDREKFYEFSRKLQAQPAFRMMMRDNKAKELLRTGNGTGLFVLMADKETERKRAFERYVRPGEYVREDARLLESAVDGLRRHAPAEGAVAAGNPELERRGKLYHEMMKRLDHAKSLAQRGVQLSGEQTKELITAVREYNDGGKKELPGGEAEAEGRLEVMCLLSRYMPEKDFRSYCRSMNEAHALTDPMAEGYIDPEAFPAERLTDGAKTAKEWYAQSQERLAKSFSLEGCAEAAAIRRLSGGNPQRVIREEELDAETKRLCAPGSALIRAMRDDKTREEYAHLAASGKAEELSTDLLAAARKHSVRTAQWQVNRSIRELTSGPVNAYVAADNLANILAARELAVKGDAGEQLTNSAFRARAEQLRSDPAFQRLARRYSEDPSFRRRMNRELVEDSSAARLQSVYQGLSAPARERREPVQEAQPEQQPVRGQEEPQPAAAP